MGLNTRMLLTTGLVLLTALLEVSLAQPELRLDVPEKVRTILGDPVTIPATFRTTRRIMSIQWSKMQGEGARQAVMSSYPIADTTEAHAGYVGRVELVRQASLKIMKTRAEDEGTYVLVVAVEGLGPQERFVKLDLLVPPTVTVGPKDPQLTTAGRSVSLTCAVRDAKPNITSLHWEKGSAIIDSNRFDTKFSGGTLQNPNLVIRHVTRGDAGRYRCIVDHEIKSASAALNLQVIYAASVISISDSRSAVISESVTLQCTADGNPPPNVTWTRNGLPVRSSTRSLSRDVRLSSVVLPSVQLNASGTYVCTASNSVGKSDMKSLQLVVEEYSMDEKSSMIAILVGALAGGLWLIICLVLAVYFFRRRRERQEKKKFSFYYNMGRRGQETINKKLQEDTLDSGRHPNPQLPAKPMLPTAPNAGIETLRRTKKQRERRYAKAMYPYYPQDDNELCLEIDDVIEVLEGEDGGWCLGYLRGRIGLFPSNYVKFLTAKEASAAKLKDLHEAKDAVKLPTKGSI